MKLWGRVMDASDFSSPHACLKPSFSSPFKKTPFSSLGENREGQRELHCTDRVLVHDKVWSGREICQTGTGHV